MARSGEAGGVRMAEYSSNALQSTARVLLESGRALSQFEIAVEPRRFRQVAFRGSTNLPNA